MHDLEIDWPGGSARFSPGDSPIDIGRTTSADVALAHPSVSRSHLQLVWDDGNWNAVDASTHGTFDPIGVRLTDRWKVGTEVVVLLGGIAGEKVTIRPISKHMTGQLQRVPVDSYDQTVVDLRPPPRPEGPPTAPSSDPSSETDLAATVAPAANHQSGNQVIDHGLVAPIESPLPPRSIAETTASFDPAATRVSRGSLRLSVDDEDYFFATGTIVTVGRDPECLVHVDERHSLVSRQHLKLYCDKNSWWIEDHSSKGTFIDGRRIKRPYKATGAFVANLGDDDAGTQLKIITSGDHKAPTSLFKPLLLGGGLLLLGVLTWLVMTVLGGDQGGDLSDEKRAAVMLIGEDGLGSGFLVSDDLIVTNQHVATLAGPKFVAISRETDEPAVVEYLAETVEVHPYLDIAVLQIVATAEYRDGIATTLDAPVGNVGLKPATIGKSSDLRIGDPIYSLGFPTKFSFYTPGNLPAVSATHGEATNFALWPGCATPGWENQIPAETGPGVACRADGDLNRGQIVTNLTSGRGASGSAVYHNDKVVAVVFTGDDTNVIKNIATDAFDDWLAEVIATYG